MTKNCMWQGCEKEINVWESYCREHWQMVQEQTKMKPVESVLPKVPEPPSDLGLKVKHDAGTPLNEQKPIKTETKKPKSTKPTPKKSLEFDMPKYTEPDRLIVKQKALEQAVKLIIQSEIGSEDFTTLIEEIRTLTVKFFGIIMEKNEGAV